MLRARGFAFGNKARVGKDEACKVLMESYGAEKVSLAEPVYEIANYIQQVLGLPQEKNRKLLQFIGEGLREILGQDIWLDVARRKIREASLENKMVCISDMRYRNEADAFAAMGLVLVHIDRSDRPAVENPYHISEVDLDTYQFDLYMWNDSTLEEFRHAVAQLPNQLRDHDFEILKARI